jgi:cobyric acid synthase
MTSRALIVLGMASDVGKSLTLTLCRIFRQDGHERNTTGAKSEIGSQ